MNETLKTIHARCACRRYSDKPVEREKIDEILKAALAAPSGLNKQGWRIIAIINKELMADLEAEEMRLLKAGDPAGYQRILSRGGVAFYNAPVMFLIVSDKQSTYWPMDCAIVAQNIALAATSLGLGNVICAMSSMIFAGDKKEEFIRRCEVPEGFSYALSVLAGYADMDSKAHEIDPDKAVVLA
ncbi:MAG: nitroreductase [Erysipelotrichaceae bacterium]|jgi:nitroreductase|nr:nitroreductase [Erysipelotrichaceae bacterium]